MVIIMTIRRVMLSWETRSESCLMLYEFLFDLLFSVTFSYIEIEFICMMLRLFHVIMIYELSCPGVIMSLPMAAVVSGKSIA